jgi:hypothetical protein
MLSLWAVYMERILYRLMANTIAPAKYFTLGLAMPKQICRIALSNRKAETERMMSKANEYAFPCANPSYDGNWNKEPYIGGMSKLEYFSGLIAANTCLSITDLGQIRHAEHAAEFAVKMAKALIAELEKVAP